MSKTDNQDEYGGVWKTLKNGHKVYIVDGQIYGSPEQYLIKSGQTKLVRNEDGTVSRVFPEKKALTDIGKNDIINEPIYESVPAGFTHRRLKLPPKEYAHVMHELNTNYAKFKNMRSGIAYIGQYAYRFENHGWNNYNIFKRWDIDGEED